MKYITLALVAVSLFACTNEDKNTTVTNEDKSPAIVTESVTYSDDSVTMNGYVAFDSNSTGKRPVVFVVPEWWGLNEYAKRRARDLAELGYLAMAVDIFGNGKTADNPDSAGKLATPFYQDPQMAKSRFDAAVAQIMTHPRADSSRLAGIGYCFGGGMLLNFARLGQNLDGVVSFHGSLIGTPANKDLLKAKLLVLHGADDPLVPRSEVDAFKKQMDSIGAAYTFKEYPGAVHAFTNPDATATGKKYGMPVAYNAAADSASWNEMKTFLADLFK